MNSRPELGHRDATRAIATIESELARRGQTAVIAVADAHGELIALVRLDGAPVSSVTVAANKAYTAARLRRPTRVLGASIQTRNIDIAYYGDARYTGFGGGVPIYAGASVVGAVAVSGLSDAEDEALAVQAIGALSPRGFTAEPAA